MLIQGLSDQHLMCPVSIIYVFKDMEKVLQEHLPIKVYETSVVYFRSGKGRVIFSQHSEDHFVSVTAQCHID